MKWTKQRIVSVGVLAAAAAAFAVDRGLLGGGGGGNAAGAGGATAAVASGPQLRAVGDGQAAHGPAAADQPMAALARQLAAVSAAEAVAPGTCGDAFSPPADWFQPAAPPEVVDVVEGAAAAPAAAAPAAAAPVSDGTEAFLAEHKLSAVLRNGPRPEQSIAVIRGRTLRVGQAIGGFTLTAVHDDDGVTLTSRSGRAVRLDLPKPDLAAAR